ncbi:HD domain-containing protein [Amycolatopsis sp. PS_44_ISF1]|uniref:HD domain-containing protein n=1 Tax=Amycolatopsis sp. PS_44_ISF1 TaxID=2974917 RepID=UPI0028E07743|nr:HD domain-containing protein [Amycolatopsis sp. PS_44_ISF1]MDT8911805.1 HD domain-containing protein [Amycolatopsis sp. PS_44_ISF1]MDT8916370.1 HD domain-containing protein [Amycolatopsis sp. PS_44_ISF1]MDT8916380.1 HD domain-containing protein [Amycolatopsis sp. PS_44_ISF1]
MDRAGLPAGLPERLLAQLRFAVEIDRLKTVVRRTSLASADRRENDAEHSWHLAVLVPLLAEYAALPIDVGHTMRLVVLHDLVEIHAGDTFLFDPVASADQRERESAAADRLFALLPVDQEAEFRGLWEEFEAHRTPEARFARSMDRFQSLLLNFTNAGGTWRTPGVTDREVRQRKEVIGDGAPALWQLAQELIGLGVERGWVARSGES